ncbi:ATP-binding protein [Streptomyces sp. L2]|uniref:ATP-binding protein n=1 Tax=Streptomyces sp. L2 TaxID=2162665 RepID=UPI001010DDCD|nr:ATP-binding protein [Streptomyces sp. L2]
MPEPGEEHRHIDRADQLARVARLTARDAHRGEDRQAMFFEGPGDIGKSSLLLEIYERHGDQGVYFVDLSRVATERDVLEALAMQARSQRVDVPSYRTTRDRFAEQSASTQVSLSNVRARNSAIQLLTQSEDRGLQTDALSDALLDNLMSDSRRPVICLDSFEACAQPMRQWLGRKLLPNLLTRPEASVFVAGRELPSLSRPYSRAVHTMVLPPFDVGAVHDWIETLGLASLQDKAVTIQQAHGGVPGLLAAFFACHIEPEPAGAGGDQDGEA